MDNDQSQTSYAEVCRAIQHLFSGRFDGKTAKIVCVDDDFVNLTLITKTAELTGCEVFGTTSTREALAYIQKNKNSIALILSDFQMPEQNGFEFRAAVLQIAPHLPFAIVSGYVDREMALQGVDLKISAFLEKPVEKPALASLFIKELTPRIVQLHEELELLTGFLDDTQSLLEQVEASALDLEREPQNKAILNSIFGQIHTVKGSSGFFEPKVLHNFAHRFEERLKQMQQSLAPVSGGDVALILKGLDIIRRVLPLYQDIEAGVFDVEALIEELTEAGVSAAVIATAGDSAPAAAVAVVKTDAKESSIRVEPEVLDEFLRASGEMTVIRSMLKKMSAAIESRYPSDPDVLQLNEFLDELHKINSNIQTRVSDIRKVSVGGLLKPMQRVVRDVSKSVQKKVDLVIEGSHLRIDIFHANILNQCLIHLLKNCIDHGLETPEERKQNGKPENGTVTISAHVDDSDVVIELGDNGRGLNEDRIKQKLIKNGADPKSLNLMSSQDVYDMIFSPGFSTAEQTTDLSGRGVGMGAVKEAVEATGGTVKIQSAPGQGTKFILKLPIPNSVLIRNCLFVSCEGQQFGIAREHVTRISHFDLNDKKILKTVAGAQVLETDFGLLPLVHLSTLFGHTPKPTGDFSIVILRCTNFSQFGLLVDAVHDFEDIVVKPLVNSLVGTDLYAGATFLSDFTVGLLLNIDALAQTPALALSAKPLHDASKNVTLSARRNWLLCESHEQKYFCIDQEDVFRIEEFETKKIQAIGAQSVIIYRGQGIPLKTLRPMIKVSPIAPPAADEKMFPAIILRQGDEKVGLKVRRIVDICTSDAPVMPSADPSDLSREVVTLSDKLYDVLNSASLFAKKKGGMTMLLRKSNLVTSLPGLKKPDLIMKVGHELYR